MDEERARSASYCRSRHGPPCRRRRGIDPERRAIGGGEIGIGQDRLGHAVAHHRSVERKRHPPGEHRRQAEVVRHGDHGGDPDPALAREGGSKLALARARTVDEVAVARLGIGGAQSRGRGRRRLGHEAGCRGHRLWRIPKGPRNWPDLSARQGGEAAEA